MESEEQSPGASVSQKPISRDKTDELTSSRPLPRRVTNTDRAFAVGIRSPLVPVPLHKLICRRRESGRLAKVPLEVVPSPTLVPQLLPRVVVNRRATVPGHAVYGRAAANHVTNAQVGDAVAEVDLRHGGRVVETGGLICGGEVGHRHVDGVGEVAVLND